MSEHLGENFLIGAVVGTALNRQRRLLAEEIGASVAANSNVPRTITRKLGGGYSVQIPNPEYHGAPEVHDHVRDEHIAERIKAARSEQAPLPPLAMPPPPQQQE